MERGKANHYVALQRGDRGSKFCQKVRYVTVEQSLTASVYVTYFRLKCPEKHVTGFVFFFKLHSTKKYLAKGVFPGSFPDFLEELLFTKPERSASIYGALRNLIPFVQF